ncbi:MAG TPA: amidohydrolase family protein [Terriglobia bacterium]|nr:amidohydrolase family protein [Terriglobia bacterium]
MTLRRAGQVWLAIGCSVAWMSAPAISPAAIQQSEKSATQGGQAAGDVLEEGKFTLHKFEQPIGEETYQITLDGDTVAAKIHFKFTDRGTEVPLEATFDSGIDLTPKSFEIKGKTSRQSTIDEDVEVFPGKIRLRDRDKSTETAPPAQFFTIAGYAPATMQMLLVRYWATHHNPETLITFPSGEVRIHDRGKDYISNNGKGETLERYTVEGLIWGRETLWFNEHRDLVAAVTTDAEFDHFEAVAPRYESHLGTFVSRAGADGMAALAEISGHIAGSQSGATSAGLALVGGTLVDGTGGPAIPDAAVVIRKGRIVAAGPESQVKIPKRAEVIDARGKTILPGLWDMHAHFEQVEWGPIYLAAGATTVRDCGNEFEFITAVRDAIAAGNGLGPRILAAGVVDGSGRLTIGVNRVDTPEEAIHWVDKYHDAGFQQMKIYSSVKLPEVKAVADEAHRLGMTVTGHVPEGLDAYEVVEAGQDQINHIAYIIQIMLPPPPDEAKANDEADSSALLRAVANLDFNSIEARKALDFLKAHHTVVDPTLTVYEMGTASTAKPTASFEPGVLKVAPELAAQLMDVGPPKPDAPLREKVFDKMVAAVGALHRAGITVVAGTDQTVPGYSLYRELELYVQAGFTPMEAIEAATIVPARVMGLDRELGTVEAGKRGDVIVLGANPLENIHNIRTVESVITGGRMYNCADLWRSVGFKP